MTCPICKTECKRFGKHRNGLQRFRCRQCGKTFTEPHERTLAPEAILALTLLLEGNSIRSAERITGLHRDTIMRLLFAAGEHCEQFMQQNVRNVPVKDVQADEVWGFVYKKEAHKWPDEAHDNSIGDCYCFIALERNSKLVLTFHVGKRDRIATEDFIGKLRDATSDQMFQLTTDGFAPYINAVDDGLADRVDFAQLIKVYASSREGEQRYSPPEVVDAYSKIIIGDPEERRICTSHVERKNGTLRQWCKRMTRLTYSFSKKWENHKAALALHFAFYNFCRIHSSLRVTPAMEAGITDRVWSITELLA